MRPDLVTPIQCPLSHHPPPFSRRAHPGRFAFRRPRILLAWHSLAAAGGAIHDAEGSYDTALLACAVTCAVGSVSSVAVCRDPAGAHGLVRRRSQVDRAEAAPVFVEAPLEKARDPPELPEDGTAANRDAQI